ncbi:hypothetical protein L596_010527 [Steinernema carpocapsae]|uniref:C-type lectin domain-containing protein n=1 Tax=Steinernema carpocapsae TaxID=34508 RepID=A0A4U5PJZ3_STECR|nr:hypothetical protein L596_010527 [Steinernema carpocapsae]
MPRFLRRQRLNFRLLKAVAGPQKTDTSIEMFFVASVLLGLFSLSVAIPPSPCIRLPTAPSGPSCYYFSKEKVDFDEAADYCNSKNGNLAVIYNAEENKILQKAAARAFAVPSYFQDTEFYIGFYSLHEWSWRWIIETDSSYTNFYSSLRPDENCAKMNAITGNWLSVNCDTKLRFVCEIYEEPTAITQRMPGS